MTKVGPDDASTGGGSSLGGGGFNLKTLNSKKNDEGIITG